jgi:mediator of RNA polymerase II transcription subunit 12
MSSAPTCFLLPHCWDKHESNIRSFLAIDGDPLHSCFQSLSRRNFNLRDRSLQANRLPTMSARDKVIGLLDNLSTERNFGKTAGACLRILKDHHLLVTTCVEWSASVYRPGHFGIYAAARLLRIWSKHGIELQRPILDFLSTQSTQVGVRKSDVYRLLAELVSSKHMSVGKYLQWLMARGTLHGHQWPGLVSIVYLVMARHGLTLVGWSV